MYAVVLQISYSVYAQKLEGEMLTRILSTTRLGFLL